MDHLISFTVSFDDADIIKAVREKAESQIISNIEKEVKNTLFNPYYPYRQNDPHHVFSNLAKDVFNDFLNENKEEILSKASIILADKLARSKAGKAILEEL